MRKIMRFLSFLLIVSLLAINPGWGYYHPERYSRGELDELAGPIALYPDPLLAQILPASTFVDQIEDAADFVRHRGAQRLIDSQDWDVSVKAVAHYPSILYMMADKPDWTTALGQAYIEQPYDVMDAIQRLRIRAQNLGYLYPTDHQDVIVRSGYVRIIPAQPRYIYAPRYDPQVVYVRRAPRRAEITKDILIFGLGLLIGSWLNRDCDWDHHRVYYHGWRGGGWVHRSRPDVTINNVYVNNRYVNRPIQVNRKVVTRDIRPYRHELRGSVGHFRPPASITKPAHFRRNAPTHLPRQQNQPKRLVRPTAGMMHGNAPRAKAMVERKQFQSKLGKTHGQAHGRIISPKENRRGPANVGQRRREGQRPAFHAPKAAGTRVPTNKSKRMERRNPFEPGRAKSLSGHGRQNVRVSRPTGAKHARQPSLRRVESRPAGHGSRISGRNQGPQLGSNRNRGGERKSIGNSRRDQGSAGNRGGDHKGNGNPGDHGQRGGGHGHGNKR
jgi:hypothetical protein